MRKEANGFLRKDPAQYLIPNLSLRAHAKYQDPTTYGTITGEPFGAGEGKEAGKGMKDGDMEFGKGKKVCYVIWHDVR